jgi:hypothetical protein
MLQFNQMKSKKFIIRKFVMAKSASDAITKEKKSPVFDVFVDEEWMREHEKKEMSFGFKSSKKKG